ncbi:MAG: hypothetical protein HY812_01480 [Planctomycetes bacterium]|nr:hypothetical protein [Planctomycetota bacterium]
MIGRLALDAVRLLLRGRALFLVLGVGLLAGLFVRATRDTGSASLHGALLRGAALETLASTLFLAGVIQALVFGLVLAAEDRGSGFLAHVALRPVGRIAYAAGRLLGLAAAVLLGTLLLALPAALLAGLGRRDLPDLFERVRASPVFAGERQLAGSEIDQIALGRPGRFFFPAGAIPDATLLLRPKVALGRAASFSGRLDLALTLETADGARTRRTPPPLRPLRELPIRFDQDVEGAPFVLEVEPLSPAFVLEIDRDALTVLGGKVPWARDAALSFLLVVLAGIAAAALAFFLGIALSPGPASLSACFVLLVGLGREAVCDIIAGMGGGAAEDAGAVPRVLRFTLDLLARLAPDFSSFNPAESLGAGVALAAPALVSALLWCLAVLLAALLLAAAAAPFEEK